MDEVALKLNDAPAYLFRNGGGQKAEARRRCRGWGSSKREEEGKPEPRNPASNGSVENTSHLTTGPINQGEAPMEILVPFLG